MVLVWIFNKPYFIKLSWALTSLGLLFQIYGFILRSVISGRAPVTNMYETVVWVPLGAIIFGMGIEYFKKNRFTLLAANLGAFLCLILADLAPTVLDPTIQPLEPVLRSNFWLSTHVTTIVISYAAFFLAFVLADINMFYFMTNPKEKAKDIKSINDSIYRAMQIGVLLLAIGIVLGGVWADYSWGRFWGWDPKETWALIALLGYIAVLHARLVGWVKQFGMSASAIASFSLVIMAWYGVNYVLGAGLHSYGFGAGGLEYVTAFVVLHFLFVGIAWLVKEQKLRT
jgi:cytochrome c-type biogenesis protein CcsB